MFNGIIYKTGSIFKVIKGNNYSEVVLKSNYEFKKSEIGSSLSCNGTCLTITSIQKKYVTFYLSKETLQRTTFRFAKIGDLINIEKSLSHGDKISGHYVQGHVDTTGHVLDIKIIDKTWIVTFKTSKAHKKYLIEKGSISINGVSLTIAKILKYGFQIAIIPQTLRLTNLIYLKVKDLVNVEFDVLGKYIKNIIK